MSDETKTIAPFYMDRGLPLGNSDDGSGRRALHIINQAAPITKKWNTFTLTQPDSQTDVYDFFFNGSPVVTVTLLYTDSTRNTLAGGGINEY